MISGTYTPAIYNGDASTDEFPFYFLILDDTDIVVTETVIATGVDSTLVLGTDYTVTGMGTGLGAVTATAAPSTLVRWTISRVMPRTQGTDYVENDSFPAETHEAALDKLTMIVQEQDKVFLRTLRQPAGDEDDIGELPPAVERASMFAAYDGDGNPIAAAGTSADLTPVSVFMNTLLDDADAATARATLGITAASNVDSDFRIVGSSDDTKMIAHEVDGLTTGQTRTRFAVDEDVSDGQGWDIKNLTMVATVGSNALTIALKTKLGADASSVSPIIVKFRNATVGTGDYTTVALTGALSLVISSGSKLGTVNSIPNRIYVGIANDAGTLRLFAYNPLEWTLDHVSLKGLHEALVYSSTEEGGAGGADLEHVLYSETAFTSKAIRLIGYVESTQATAGTWATTPSKIHLLKDGDLRTGDYVQRRWIQDGTTATGTTTIPADDTVPTITEGTEFMTMAITPTSAANILEIEHVGQYDNGAATLSIIAALFQDATSAALAAQLSGRASTGPSEVILKNRRLALTVSSTTFRIRAGASSAGTTRFNGSGGAQLFGGAMASTLSIDEVFV